MRMAQQKKCALRAHQSEAAAMRRTENLFPPLVFVLRQRTNRKRAFARFLFVAFLHYFFMQRRRKPEGIELDEVGAMDAAIS